MDLNRMIDTIRNDMSNMVQQRLGALGVRKALSAKTLRPSVGSFQDHPLRPIPVKLLSAGPGTPNGQSGWPVVQPRAHPVLHGRDRERRGWGRKGWDEKAL